MTRPRPYRAFVPLSSGVLLAGCGHSPNFNILGSYFPGWLACMVFGIVLAAFLRLLLSRMDVEHTLPWLPLFYFGVATIFACLFWLVFFD